MGVGGGVEFGLETWNGIPVGFSGANLGTASVETNAGAQLKLGFTSVREISLQQYLELSVPYVPVGQYSSARPDGVFGLIRQGFETNALDVMADRVMQESGLSSIPISERGSFNNGFNPDQLGSIKLNTEASINSGWPNDNNIANDNENQIEYLEAA